MRDTGRAILSHQRIVEFLQQDLREEMPAGRFDLICCRNLAFTYFEESLQGEILLNITDKLHHGAVLVIGEHEQLPFLPQSLLKYRQSMGIYLRSD